MILVDPRDGNKESSKRGMLPELVAPIRALHVPCEPSHLIFADACFEGRGPLGTVLVGVERKRLHDMLNCIDDARYNAQRVGMKNMYDVSVLMIEGHWKPHDETGHMMEGFSGGMAWGYMKPAGRRVMYNKLFRYLISVQLSGVIVSYSRDLHHTAFNIVEFYHYFQKPWTGHTSLLEMQKFAIPTLNAKPSLVRKWANDIDGIGTKYSEEAEKLFKTPIKLATSDEMDWLKIKGIGVPTAQSVTKQIWGLK